MHQIADAEVGSRHISRNNRVAVDRQIGERSREHAAGFFLRPVKLVTRGARYQRMSFAINVKITKHLGPDIDSFLVWIAKQPINRWKRCRRLFAPGAVEHVCDASSQQGASGLL